MSKNTLAAGTSPFAHLLAGAAALGSRALGRRAEEDDTDPKGEEEEKDVDDGDPEAEDDKPEDCAEDDEPGDDEKKARRGKRAKAEDDDAEAKAQDDDDDEEMAKARREGFRAAQARGRKIFSAASAGLRPDMAAHLAFNEDRPSADAISLLDMAAGGTSKPEGSRLGRRMARVVIPNPGTGGDGARKSAEMSFGERAKAAAEKAGIFK